MKIAICDDEQNWVDLLRSMLNEYFNSRHIECRISTFLNGLDLIESQENYDIIFMDYQLGGLNGIEVSQKMREKNIDCAIIFVSSYPDAAVDAFEVDAYRFLVKPIDKEKLFGSLDAYRKRRERSGYLIIKSRIETISIKTTEIIFCEAEGKHTTIHTVNGNIKVLKNIKEIEHRLSTEYFFRCHKAYIVSFAHIRLFDNEQIIFDDNSRAFISRNYLSAFKSAFHEYVLKYSLERFE